MVVGIVVVVVVVVLDRVAILVPVKTPISVVGVRDFGIVIEARRLIAGRVDRLGSSSVFTLRFLLILTLSSLLSLLLLFSMWSLFHVGLVVLGSLVARWIVSAGLASLILLLTALVSIELPMR